MVGWAGTSPDTTRHKRTLNALPAAAVVAVQQNDLGHLGLCDDLALVTHAHHVLGVLTLASVTHLGLTNLVGLEALTTQGVDHLDRGDEAVAIATALVGLGSHNAGGVEGDLAVGQGIVRTELGLLGR